MTFASNTNVSEEKTRSEIEQMLKRYGADEFGYMSRPGKAIIGFACKGMRVEMSVSLPLRDEKRFTLTPNRHQKRTEVEAFKAWDQEVRRRWRSLALVIKGLLVGIQTGGGVTFSPGDSLLCYWYHKGSGLACRRSDGMVIQGVHACDVEVLN